MDFQDAALKDLLKIFSIQAGLNFIASEAVQDRKITLYLDKVSIKEAMEKIFKANNLTYVLDENSNIFLVQDWGKPELERITKVYYLKYRSVPSAKLEKEKSSLFQSSDGKAGAPAAPAPAASPGSETAAVDIVSSIKQALSPKGKIAEDSSTNSLIVTDVPSSFKAIEHIISCLDIPQPQIMLDVEILDVTRDVVDKLGFNWEGLSSFAINLKSASRLTSFPLSGFNSDRDIINDKVTYGKLSFPTDLKLVLDFLKTQADTRYLARPRLLTLNNETAEISITKDEVVGIKASESTTTAGTVRSVEFIRATDLKLTKEGVGVFLRVTPQLNPETNDITMVVNPKSSITKKSELAGAESQADAEVRSSKSIVKVKDGETVIIGGLIHKDSVMKNKKVSFLGDLPFLGALFRSKDNEKDLDRELLIFITPRIVKGTNISVPQADKIVLSARGHEIVPSINRQSFINEYLNKFDKKAK
jgi:type II secretory pathway component GspD/PulD (secretin)